MIGIEPGLTTGGPSRQHMAAGTGAMLLSLAMHAGLLFLLTRLNMEAPILVRRAPPRQEHRSIRLRDVKRAPPAAEESVRSWSPGSAADVVPGQSLPRMPPDEAVIQPPGVKEGLLEGDDETLAQPGAPPLRKDWDSKQEIVAVERRIVAADEGLLARRKVLRVARVRNLNESGLLPDTTLAAEAAMAAGGAGAAAGPGRAAIARRVEGGAGGKGEGVSLRERRAESGATLFSETPAQITSLRPIESLLSAEVTVYETLRDWRYGYFRIEIRRIGPEALPVLPKDVLLVQDCSASMAEQRLYFCRQGLARCLEQIGPQDRFAVVGFRDKVEKCFDGWAENNATNRARASAFIGGMVSAGETDIFGSIQSLLDIKGSTRRPVVAVMVSDGQPTAGVVDSSDIIGKFSKLNDGAISVFAMGTVQTANAYLLDLLSYCNGGESLVVTKGRWDIPDSLAGLASQTARPVLNAVRFRFAEGGGCEVYPASTGNLYLDRPMALTGRYVRGTPGVVFQAVGRGLKADCDMIFNLDLSKARRTDDRGLRETWASQKIYHLIGQHARTGDPKTLEEIRATARAYGLRVPYRGEF